MRSRSVKPELAALAGAGGLSFAESPAGEGGLLAGCDLVVSSSGAQAYASWTTGLNIPNSKTIGAKYRRANVRISLSLKMRGNGGCDF
jgi:hypothetical protein